MINDFNFKSSFAIEPLFGHYPYREQDNGDKPGEYQHAGVEYVLQRKNGIVGDAPGVGKTLQGIMVSNTIEAERTLVVCPASLRTNWEREIGRWSTLDGVSVHTILKGKDGVDLTADYVITSYDLLRNDSIIGGIMERHWDHVILDEAHALKDPKGNKRTKAICAPNMLPCVTGRFTALSGTIIPNQPIELYNIMRLLDWDSIDRVSLAGFRSHFYKEGEGFIRGPVYDPQTDTFKNKLHWSDKVRNVPTNLDELGERLRCHLMIRRLRQDVLKDLPPATWHPFPLTIDGGLKKALAHPGWAEAERLYEMDPGAFEQQAMFDDQISTAHRLLGEAKAPHVVAYIRDLLASGVSKLVVGGWHRSVLDYMREELGARATIVYMDGRSTPKQKQAAVDAFQDDPDVQIILGQMKPLGEGWTLTAAQDIVLAEPYWVPAVNEQFFDRISRRGQKGEYTIGHVPVVPDTLDEKIIGRNIEKSIVINDVLDNYFVDDAN